MDDDPRTVRCAALSATRFAPLGSADELAALRGAFSRQRAVVLSDFLTDELRKMLGRLWRAATFAPQTLPGLGGRAIETPGRTADALCLMLARPQLYRWLEGLTGCAPLGGVTGDVAQLAAGSGDGLLWHDDRGEPDRRLAVTVNLGEAPHEGGVFELRRRATGEVVFRHAHRTSGEALIFEIAAGLEHRVLPVTGGGPRTAFAGWFLGA
jgi:hypothetical protein